MTGKRKNLPSDPVERAEHALESLRQTIREANGVNKDLIRLNNELIAFVQSDVLDVVVDKAREFAMESVKQSVSKMLGDVRKNMDILKRNMEHNMAKTLSMLSANPQSQHIMAAGIMVERGPFTTGPEEDGTQLTVHVLHEHTDNDGIRKFAFGNKEDSDRVMKDKSFRQALEAAISQHYPDYPTMQFGNFGNLGDNLK